MKAGLHNFNSIAQRTGEVRATASWVGLTPRTAPASSSAPPGPPHSSPPVQASCSGPRPPPPRPPSRPLLPGSARRVHWRRRAPWQRGIALANWAGLPGQRGPMCVKKNLSAALKTGHWPQAKAVKRVKDRCKNAGVKAV